MFMRIGLFLGAALLATGASFSQERTPAPRAPDQYGRFVVTFSPFARADTFLVDTQSGKVWQLTRYTDIQGDPLVFMPIERIDGDSQFETWLRRQRLKSDQDKK